MLSAKQEKFCIEYMDCGSATQAAMKAGYSKKTAYSIGSENLRKPEICDKLEEMKVNLAESIGVTNVMLAKELKKIAMANVSDTRTSWLALKDFKKLPDEVKAAIAEIHYETKKVGKSTVKMVRIKMHNKLSAIEELNKMLGYNAPAKVEHTGKDGEGIQLNVSFSPGEVKEISSQLESKY